jgi:hypothetical protein
LAAAAFRDGSVVLKSLSGALLMPLNPLLQRVAKKIRKLFTKPPEDPHEYALVGAPVHPKPPTLSAKAAAIPDRYDLN